MEIVWARTVRCDIPLCTQEASVDLGKDWPSLRMPAGWLNFRNAHVTVLAPGGLTVNILCPEHSMLPVAGFLGLMATVPAVREGS